MAHTLECAIPQGAQPLTVQLTSDGKLPYDPSTTGFAHITFYNAVLGRLIKLNANLTVEPGLLEDAYWDFKNSRYILKLRKGQRFHNGRQVKAEDLEFSLVRFFLSSKRVDPIAFLRNIKGVEKLSPGQKYKPWSVTGIRRVDDLTIGVKLSAANPAFLYSLAEGWVSIVPREALDDDLVTWKKYPIGAGPYQVREVADGKVTVCRIAPDEGAPSVVQFVSGSKANADVIGFLSADAVSASLTKVYGSGPIGFTGIFFNSNNPLGADVHFRRAIGLAIQREAIVNGTTDFASLTQILTTNFYGRLNVPEAFNLKQAKAELAQVPGFTPEKKLKAQWFTGRTVLSPTEKHVIETVAAQMRSLGIDLEFGSSNHPTFAENDSETVLRIDDRGTAFADPIIIFRAFEKPAFLSPFFPKDNLALKTLLGRAAKAQSLDVKAETIYDLSKYFSENSIVIPLYERKTVYWINPTKVKDLGIQTGITFDLERVKTVKL